MWAMASPMPLDAPVTMAARSGIGGRARTLPCSRVRRSLMLLLLLPCLMLAACGGDDSDPESASGATGTAAATSTDVKFPDGSNRTIRALRDGLPEGAIFAPSVSLMRVGENRIGFALFDSSRKQIVPDAVALYIARSDGRHLRGPFPATK